MNKHIKKYLARNLKKIANRVNTDYGRTDYGITLSQFRLSKLVEIIEHETPKERIAQDSNKWFGNSIHKSNKAEYVKNLDGTITVKPTNPDRKVDNENSIVKISNDEDGWNFFRNEIKPFFPKGTKFRYFYRCPNDGKPYPKAMGNVTRKRGKVVSIYIS